ncbi:glutamyl-tRNA(Gln) amidotransferase subunit PET112 [Ascoidea rubescens DSM 1968]|uniref:Glutamyl-tRNA(Gln) amidotransferase subunit B, mitochondrial n=1 Tax=Ascoidea rubescens DSM 1968 TaxID=1344418 RepID=A0A1D2VIL4_9ASCO|nr:Glutamyl-tRNA amidotransferase B subunit [Ascoidea rubescens DSM 1968]ODV61343.1 Glutamyl-tRNA amidotransferase B subunit [Ascoidea rubescens DSM 1968]
MMRCCFSSSCFKLFFSAPLSCFGRRSFTKTDRPLKKRANKKFKIYPDYKLKCGLEIHSQLKTTRKLFSLSENHQFDNLTRPNSNVSYFDISLPGTQPLLNPEALLLSLKCAIALNSNINLHSTFDRKHYFYLDQPLGYQITQHYNPFAKNGFVKLQKSKDDIDELEKIITIDQIQIEQDTGKSLHSPLENHLIETKINLNRANIPLIELVTNPDFENLKQVRAFLKKYQSILKFLNICTADLETGAMRVDVNISINNGKRVEIKNLSSTSAIANAIKYEYLRQVDLIQNGQINKINQETRGWNGYSTEKLRDKETAIDYRYMPDPELPPILLHSNVISGIKSNFVQQLPDDVIDKLTSNPYNLRVKDANLLISEKYPLLLDYYSKLFHSIVSTETLLSENTQIDAKTPSNWLFHHFLGNLTKFNVPIGLDNSTLTVFDILSVEKFAELINLIYIHKKITTSTGKLILAYLVENYNNHQNKNLSINEIIDKFDLNAPENLTDDLNTEIEQICLQIMDQFQNIVKDIKSGEKTTGIKYLIGMAMKSCQGRIQPKVFEETFTRLIKNK